MKIEETPCPTCNRVGTLYVEVKLVAKPIGSFSLAGAQTKVTAESKPFLLCSVCHFTKMGKFSEDGYHVEF